jgi:hypothetical protein
LINQDLIGSRHKTPRLVRYNDHNIGSVLAAKHQGQLETSTNNNLGSVLVAKHQGWSDTLITNNQQPMHDKPTSFTGKLMTRKKKKHRWSFAGDSPELR